MNLTDIQNIMQLSDGIYLCVNKREKTILFVYESSKCVAKSLSYSEFIEYFCENQNISIESPSIEETAKWLYEPSISLKHTQVSIVNKNNKSIDYAIKKVCLDSELVIITIENITESKKHYSLLDPLTNTYQKDFVPSLIASELNDKKHKEFFFFVLDVDNFKHLNDNYGHLTGDHALKILGKILNETFEDGYSSRIGGDEFLTIVYDKNDYNNVWKRLYNLCSRIDQERIHNPKLATFTVTIGAVREGIDGSNYDDLFMKADKALYRGKRKGKNCFIIYSDEKHKDILPDLIRKQDDLSRDRSEVSNSKLIVTAFDILTREHSFKENISILLEYICNYFVLDRGTVFLINENNLTESLYSFYNNPKNKASDATLVSSQQSIDLWNNHSRDGVVSMSQIDTLKTVHPKLYELLYKQNISSVIRYNLEFNDKKLGSLRFDMCNARKRTWQLEEIELLKIIAKIISIYLYKMNESEILAAKLRQDNLTGLINYHTFLNEGTEILTKNTLKMSVLYFNICNFKYINETLGFNQGDVLLKAFGNNLRNHFYDSDLSLISRCNDDRFIVMEPYVSNDRINSKLNSIIKRIEDFELESKDTFKMDISCGIYVTDGTENNISSAVDKANLARKYASNQLHIPFCFYTEQIKESYFMLNELEQHFKEALVLGEFQIYLQPKVNIETGKIIGAEALSRWNYRFKQLLYPNEFISILENKKYITDLDYYVFKKVCEFLDYSIMNHYEVYPISVNLSKCEERLEEYVVEIEKIRKEYGINPNLIEIEITESIFNESANEVCKIMNELHELGYKISMDDFGSGYSNLILLANLNFDVLKMDRSLCVEKEDVKKQVIMSSIISMSNQLNIPLICEGVETKSQASNLQSLGCRYAQGYLYDKPLPIVDFVKKYIKKN